MHAILGENGAGKSTLIKIMAGVVAPDEGRMTFEGREVTFASPAAANQAGIVCIFQELSLIPDLSVADNIVISNPPRRFGLIDRREQRRIAEEALARAGAEDIHPRRSAEGPAAVAAADGRDRQGARPQAAHSHPRRGDLGADRGRRHQGIRRPQAPAQRGPRAPLHLAPHARDRRDRRRVHGVPQRPQRRHLSRRDEVRQRSGRDDDRPRIQPCLPAEAARAAFRQAAGDRGTRPLLDGPAEEHFARRPAGRGRRSRRSRRPGPARIPARAFRRAARRDRRDADRRKAGLDLQPARGEEQEDRHGAHPRGPQDRGADAADVGARQPHLCRARPLLPRRRDRP